MNMDPDTKKLMLDELRRHTKLLQGASRAASVIATCIGLLVALAVVNLVFGDRLSAVFQAREGARDSWREARALVDKGDLAQGKAMVVRLIAKNPRNYYGYRLLGFVEQELGNMKESETSFARACELFPTEENEKNLTAIRKVRSLDQAGRAAAPNP